MIYDPNEQAVITVRMADCCVHPVACAGLSALRGMVAVARHVSRGLEFLIRASISDPRTAAYLKHTQH
jgi:hypothetical protein